MRNRLLNLYRANGRKNASIRADGNTIYLYDVIAGSESDAEWWGGVSAEGLARTLAGMTGPVSLRIDSPGGDVFGGRAMAQAIREYADGVTVHIDGLAASAASYVAIAGKSVIAAPGSFVMIHKAWTLAIGNADDLRAGATLLEKIDGTIAESYAAKAGDAGAATDWAALMAAETWLTAAEAAALGLVDQVLTEASAPADRARSWDLSAYAAAPALPEPGPADQPTVPEARTETAAANEIAARRRRLAVDLLNRTA